VTAAVAVVVAGITAITTDRRQDRQLRHDQARQDQQLHHDQVALATQLAEEGEQLANRLAHDCAMAERAELRELVDEAAVALHRASYAKGRRSPQ
jgi:hypothetical protein